VLSNRSIRSKSAVPSLPPTTGKTRSAGLWAALRPARWPWFWGAWKPGRNHGSELPPAAGPADGALCSVRPARLIGDASPASLFGGIAAPANNVLRTTDYVACVRVAGNRWNPTIWRKPCPNLFAGRRRPARSDRRGAPRLLNHWCALETCRMIVAYRAESNTS